MPPSRRIIKSPPASPAASEPSQLSLDQDTLLDIAIHVDAALREVHATGGDIDVSFFLTSIDDELEAVNHVFGAYPPGVEVPKYHPILGYLAQVLDSSKDKTKALLSFDFAEVAWLCAANAKSTSNRASVLNQPDLLGLVPRVPHEHRWWLPPARKLSKDATMDRPTFDYDDGEDGEAPESPVSPDAASFFAAASPEPEDVDMANDNDGETPRRRTRLSKRSLAMSPGNDAPVKQRKRVCDPKDACGPCKNKGHECIDQGGAHTFSCVACSNSKIRCDPLNKLVAARKVENDTRDSEAAEKKAADDAACAAKKRAGKKPQDLPKAPKTQGKPSKGRPKKHNMPDAVNDNTAALEALHIYLVAAIEKIKQDLSDLRAIVIVQQSGSHVPTRLIPPPPTFQEPPAAAPSPTSLTSNISSGSSMHIAALTLDSPQARLAGLPVAGPSGVRRDLARVHAPGLILQSSSEQTQGTAMVKPPSRAPSVPLSRRASQSRT